MGMAIKPNDECFVVGIREYKHNLFRMAKSILHNDTEAEDAVGETICKAYSKLNSLRSFVSFKPWLMKILVNECYAAAKQRNRIDYRHQAENLNSGVLENSQVDHELWAIVYQLDQEFSSVVILFYYEDLSIKEIAKILSLAEGTVKSRLSRAKQKLKVLLENEGGIINGSI